MILRFKYNGTIYEPNNDLAMYDLIQKLTAANYKITNDEQHIKELEARNRRLQREVARLDRLIIT